MIKKIIAIIILITFVLFFFWGESEQDLGDTYIIYLSMKL